MLNFKKNLIILLFLTIFPSCTKIVPQYYISEFPEIQQFEEFDHQSCQNLKLNFDAKNNLESKNYWRCRQTFAKFHLEINPVFPNQIDQNSKISELIAKISLKISRSQESFLQNEINKIDENDNLKCEKMGYKIDPNDQLKTEEYYLCRKNLIELFYAEPPFGNAELLKFQDKNYDINYVVTKKIREAMQINQKILEDNPQCAEIKPRGMEFAKCLEDFKKYNQCLSKNNLELRRLESDQKIICQKQAYIRFSDEMIVDRERTDSAISMRNQNSDRDNKYSFGSMGIDEDDFLAKNEKEEKKKVVIKKLSDIQNHKNNIYTKQEISRLRRGFISNCIKIINKDLNERGSDLNKKCEKIKSMK